MYIDFPHSFRNGRSIETEKEHGDGRFKERHKIKQQSHHFDNNGQVIPTTKSKIKRIKFAAAPAAACSLFFIFCSGSIKYSMAVSLEESRVKVSSDEPVTKMRKAIAKK